MKTKWKLLVDLDWFSLATRWTSLADILVIVDGLMAFLEALTDQKYIECMEDSVLPALLSVIAIVTFAMKLKWMHMEGFV